MRITPIWFCRLSQSLYDISFHFPGHFTSLSCTLVPTFPFFNAGHLEYGPNVEQLTPEDQSSIWSVESAKPSLMIRKSCRIQALRRKWSLKTGKSHRGSEWEVYCKSLERSTRGEWDSGVTTLFCCFFPFLPSFSTFTFLPPSHYCFPSFLPSFEMESHCAQAGVRALAAASASGFKAILCLKHSWVFGITGRPFTSNFCILVGVSYIGLVSSWRVIRLPPALPEVLWDYRREPLHLASLPLFQLQFQQSLLTWLPGGMWREMPDFAAMSTCRSVRCFSSTTDWYPSHHGKV